MPYHWTRIHASPAKERRDTVARICREHRARLCENQIFFDDQGNVHALIEVRDGATDAELQALLDALEAFEWLGKVDADEKDGGKRAPKSGHK